MSQTTRSRPLPADDARAIKSALEYLYMEAVHADLRLAAHLIGAASEAIDLDKGLPASTPKGRA